MTVKNMVVRQQLVEAYERFCIKYEYIRPSRTKIITTKPMTLKAESQEILPALAVTTSLVVTLKIKSRRKRTFAEQIHHEKCAEEICRLADEFKRFCCKYCAGDEYKRKYGRTTVLCTLCRKAQSLVENIQFFRGAKNLTERLLLFELLRQGLNFNAKEFSDTLNKSSNTGVELFRKINQVKLQELKAQKRLTSAPLVEFMVIFTDRRPLPIDAQRKRTRAILSTKNGAFRSMPRVQQNLYRALGRKPVHVDILVEKLKTPIGNLLAAITALEMEGLVVVTFGLFVARVYENEL